MALPKRGPERRGRPSRGDRVTTAAQLPRAVREECERLRDERGYKSLSDLLIAIIAPAVGMPEEAPQPAPEAQQPELNVEARIA